WPAPTISAAVASAASARRSETTTDAPRSASSLATARPMPCPAPVTTATSPSSSPTGRLQDRDGCDSRRPAHVVCETPPSTVDLVRRIPPQLLEELDALGHAGGARRVSL